MTNLEKAYDCAGLDNKKLFYYSRNYELDIGIPGDVCTEEQIHAQARLLLEEELERQRQALEGEAGALASLTAGAAAICTAIAYMIF